MNILKIQNPPVTYTQTIYATLWIAGEQKVGVDTHGVRGPGSHIAVAAEQVLIYLHDLNAARTYADAWIDAVQLAKQLPATGPVIEQHTGPALMVRAHGHDQVDHVYDTTLQAVVIRIGNFTWLVRDRTAYATMRTAWMQVRDIAPIMLPSRSARGSWRSRRSSRWPRRRSPSRHRAGKSRSGSQPRIKEPKRRLRSGFRTSRTGPDQALRQSAPLHGRPSQF